MLRNPKKSREPRLGLGSPICPWRPGSEVPAALYSEVVAKGDVVHGLRRLEHHMLPALKHPAKIAHKPVHDPFNARPSMYCRNQSAATY